MLPLSEFTLCSTTLKPRTISLQDALKKLSEVNMKKAHVPLQTLSKFFFHSMMIFFSTELTVCLKSVNFGIKVLFSRHFQTGRFITVECFVSVFYNVS